MAIESLENLATLEPVFERKQGHAPAGGSRQLHFGRSRMQKKLSHGQEYKSAATMWGKAY